MQIYSPNIKQVLSGYYHKFKKQKTQTLIISLLLRKL